MSWQTRLVDRFATRSLVILTAGVGLAGVGLAAVGVGGCASNPGPFRVMPSRDGAPPRGIAQQAAPDDQDALTEARSARRVSGPSGECTEGAVPDFPTPAPAPSSRMALPRGFLNEARQQANSRLHHAADELDELLMSLGYSERAYFRLRERDQTVGFALVTRMERIHPNGRPYPDDRRFIPAGIDDRFSVLEFLKSLFIAPVGHYRVLVFTVSREPVRATGPQIGGAGADQWLSTGSTRLLGCVARVPFTDEFGVDVLIYEFRHAPEEDLAAGRSRRSTRVSQVIPSKLDPAVHLRRTGIFGAPSPRTQP